MRWTFEFIFSSKCKVLIILNEGLVMDTQLNPDLQFGNSKLMFCGSWKIHSGLSPLLYQAGRAVLVSFLYQKTFTGWSGRRFALMAEGGAAGGKLETLKFVNSAVRSLPLDKEKANYTRSVQGMQLDGGGLTCYVCNCNTLVYLCKFCSMLIL